MVVEILEEDCGMWPESRVTRDGFVRTKQSLVPISSLPYSFNDGNKLW